MVDAFSDKINLIFGGLAAILAYVFGQYWFLFVAFLALNIIDYVTGTMKAYMGHNVSSNAGFSGVVKKFGSWLMVFTAFMMSWVFMSIGDLLEVNLAVTSLIGWFVLATLIINEIRSIIENFIEMGFKVPAILTAGLELANNVIENAENLVTNHDPEENDD